MKKIIWEVQYLSPPTIIKYYAAIYSKIDSKFLNPDLLDLLYANDEALADQYAMDTKFLRQNGVETGSSYYNVTGGCFSCNDPVELHIISRSRNYKEK